MLKSYLKIALRNLYHDKIFTAINIVGLSVGFACVMLIMLYVNDEVSYDKFHKNARELYRVVAVLSGKDGTNKMSRQGLPVGPAFKKEIPGVQHVIRSKKADAIIQLKNAVVHETIFYCDKEFFSVFSFPLLYGNAASVLNEINSVVLTKEKAVKIFGTTDVVGKTVSIKLDSVFENVIVTGIVENVPQNSSIQFDFILPITRYEKTSAGSNMNWMSFNVSTFLLLHPNADPRQIEAQFPVLVDKYLGKRLSEMNKSTGDNASLAYSLQNIKDIHLDTSFTDKGGNIKTSDPVGKQISLGDSKKATIVGMVKDYHFQSLHEKIMPLVLHCGFKPQMLDESLIKIEPHDIPQTLKYIEETFKKLSPFHPLQYNFLEQLNASEYAAEQKWKDIISYTSALSVLISCLGLFGLTTLSIVRRTKEIGIRKILGASTGGITLLVSKDFVKLIMVAFVISIPFAWYSAHQWLENFAYRINIEWWIFGIAGFITVLIALLTVSLQAIKAAIANPVKSLKTE